MHVIDSHTGGQPTRVILEGGPELGQGPMSERKKIFAEQFDDFRTKSILEPKCTDAMVGALLCEPVSSASTAGVIFFNNDGYLDMCGHGTIGLLATLAHLGRADIGEHLIETSVGKVKTELLSRNRVSVENVPSYCLHNNVALEVESLGTITGHIAWGGNWFFLVDKSPVSISRRNIPALTDAAKKVRQALARQSVTGSDEAEIDHIEFFEESSESGVNSRNFVLCPGLAYDRSPCGTGTSAKIACLVSSGKLLPGVHWIQEGVTGTRFIGTYDYDENGKIRPRITGEAYIYADTNLIFQAGDPLQHGAG
ncbi:proline racemase family protein [Parasphingorhabdus sp.]|jgi:4-hydroxyproline epimerase|uniref:proline racemase family protein n=1 Tax=Parasphingorhabdus sp. TaxID=2709688 RepID=UPI0007F42557|nr:hydroxyproline-2-epimerase [Sphingomonadales bacterium EhC05]